MCIRDSHRTVFHLSHIRLFLSFHFFQAEDGIRDAQESRGLGYVYKRQVIGLEVHVQLSTNTKLFSGASTTFGAEPNTNVDLIDLGLPGVLPVVNREAFHKAIRFGLATNPFVQ